MITKIISMINDHKFRKIHYRLGVGLFAVVLCVSGCDRQSSHGKPEVNNSFSDSLFVSGLTEYQIGDSRYMISLPADYYIEMSEGPDFDVYYIQPVDTTTFGPFYIGLYFGNHPALLPPRSDTCRIERRASLLLNINAEWEIYRYNDIYFAQTMIKIKDDESWDEMIHAWSRATSEVNLHRLLDVFHTMKIKDEH